MEVLGGWRFLMSEAPLYLSPPWPPGPRENDGICSIPPKLKMMAFVLYPKSDGICSIPPPKMMAFVLYPQHTWLLSSTHRRDLARFRAWGWGGEGLGVEVWGLGSGVWGLWFGVWGLGFGVWGSRFQVWWSGFGVRLQGFGSSFQYSGLMGFLGARA